MSLEPAKYTLRAIKGATFRKTITVLSGGLGSDPRDFTGYTATFTIKDEDDVVLLALTETDGLTLGGSEGTVEVVITSTQTTAASWAHGRYDLKLTDVDGSGDTDALLYGVFTIKTL